MILEGSKLEKEGWREREGGVCACWGVVVEKKDRK